MTLAHDGLEALSFVESAIAKQEIYSVVFMDIQMPHLDGIACTKKIRELGYKGPVVALTAYADDTNQKTCFAAGMDGFLVKPIAKARLKEVLDVYAWGNGESSLPMTPWSETEASTPGRTRSFNNGTVATESTSVNTSRSEISEAIPNGEII